MNNMNDDMNVKKWSYGCELPVWVHQCHVLKINTSIPLQASPLLIESSFNTRPSLSWSRSTKYAVRYRNNSSPYS